MCKLTLVKTKSILVKKKKIIKFENIGLTAIDVIDQVLEFFDNQIEKMDALDLVRKCVFYGKAKRVNGYLGITK